MGRRATFAGHPILEPIAVGGFVLSFAFDLAGMVTASATPSVLSQAAYYTMIFSIVGALAASMPGLVHLFAPPADVGRTAAADVEISLSVVGIYILNAWLRHLDPHDQHFPMVLSLVGVILLLVSGWLVEKMAASTFAGHRHVET